MSYLSVFKMEFEKTIVLFDASTFELFKMQSFMQNKEISSWSPKCPIWVCLGCNKKLLSFL